MIDTLKLAKKTEPSEAAASLVGAVVGFVTEGAKLYPAMVAEIKAQLAAGKGPAKFLDTEGTVNPLSIYWEEAKQLGPKGFDLALVPYAQCGGLDPEQRKTRNAALECARKWFTELLHQSVAGAPMGLRLLTDEQKTHKLC